MDETNSAQNPADVQQDVNASPAPQTEVSSAQPPSTDGPKSKLSLSRIWLIVGFVFILAVVAAGAFWLGRSGSVSTGQTQTATPSPVAEPTSSPPTTTTAPASDAQPTWQEYWDPRFGFGVAVPSHWTVYPTSTEGRGASATMMNYDPNQSGVPENLPEGAVKMDFWVDVMDPALSVTQWAVAFANQEVGLRANVADVTIGTHSVALVEFEDENVSRLIVFRLTTDAVLAVSIFPGSSLSLPDVRSMLASVAVSDVDEIVLPSSVPAPLIVFQSGAR